MIPKTNGDFVDTGAPRPRGGGKSATVYQVRPSTQELGSSPFSTGDDCPKGAAPCPMRRKGCPKGAYCPVHRARITPGCPKEEAHRLRIKAQIAKPTRPQAWIKLSEIADEKSAVIAGYEPVYCWECTRLQITEKADLDRDAAGFDGGVAA